MVDRSPLKLAIDYINVLNDSGKSPGAVSTLRKLDHELFACGGTAAASCSAGMLTYWVEGWICEKELQKCYCGKFGAGAVFVVQCRDDFEAARGAGRSTQWVNARAMGFAPVREPGLHMTSAEAQPHAQHRSDGRKDDDCWHTPTRPLCTYLPHTFN